MPDNWTSAVVWCLVATAAIEAVTCLLRFSFQLEATRDTDFLSPWTFGFRIHHGYLGVAAGLAGALFADGSAMVWSLVAGAALVFSDLIHHFIVLRLVTGEPEFDLFYP